MKKLIPIKLQYFFMFIPFLNIFVLLMYLINIHRSPDGFKLFLKSILIYFFSAVTPMLLFLLAEKIFGDLSRFSFIGTYIVPLFMAFCLIQFQKKNMRFKDNKE